LHSFDDKFWVRDDIRVLPKPSCQLVPKVTECELLCLEIPLPLDILALLFEEDGTRRLATDLDFARYDVVEFATCGKGGDEGFESDGAGRVFIGFVCRGISFDAVGKGCEFVKVLWLGMTED
jgi:hypothetical protein